MHHMMEKASVIWSKETGIDRNPADQVEVYRPDDQRERYLSAEEISSLKCSLDQKMYRADAREINRTFYRLRMIVLIALTTGMRIAEIFGLTWNDLHYSEGLIAVRSKLKGGKIRYVPLTPELAVELRKYPAVIGEEQLFRELSASLHSDPRPSAPKCFHGESGLTTRQIPGVWRRGSTDGAVRDNLHAPAVAKSEVNGVTHNRFGLNFHHGEARPSNGLRKNVTVLV